MIVKKEFLGNLPRILKGVNKTRLNRQATADLYGFSFQQIHKAYNNWNMLFKRKNSTLTFKEYLDKMVEVKITPDDLGTGIDDYNLCRVNDEGDYHNYNCSFKPKRENLAEQIRENPYVRSLNKYGFDKVIEIARLAGKARWGH